MNPVIQLNCMKRNCAKTSPNFAPLATTVRVNVRLKEGEGEKEKERLQAFEGVVISKKGRASGATFTVRRVSFGVGIERIFPLHSPSISSIEVVGKGKVRRARLYYLRGSARQGRSHQASSPRRSGCRCGRQLASQETKDLRFETQLAA